MNHPWWLSGKESACNVGDTGDMSSIPGSEKSPGEWNGYPVQYSCLDNPMDRGDWWATVYGVAESYLTKRLSTSTQHIPPCVCYTMLC